jgi:hypothetical protein
MALTPQEIFEFYLRRGYQPHQAAAIVGSLQQESQFNPQAVGDEGTAFGMGQWRGPRFQNLQKLAKTRGTSWTDPETQLIFLDWEVRGGGDHAGKKILASRDLNEALSAAYDFWRPAASREVEMHRRGRFAAPLLEEQRFVPKPVLPYQSPRHPDVMQGLVPPSTDPSQFIPLPRSKPQAPGFDWQNMMGDAGGLLQALGGGGSDEEQQALEQQQAAQDLDESARRNQQWFQGLGWL